MTARRARVWAVVACGLPFACAPLPEAGMRPSEPTPAEAPIPPGYGSLRPDEISIHLSEGPLEIELTPLDEEVLRLLVPDAAERLRGVAELGGPASGSTPFLVTFFTETQGLRFEQSDVTLEAGGRVLRASRVVGATQGWGTGLLRQREPASAVYLFPAVDFDVELIAVYRTVRSDEWTRILPRIQAERGRVRGRAGGGGYSSSPNFRIFR